VLLLVLDGHIADARDSVSLQACRPCRGRGIRTMSQHAVNTARLVSPGSRLEGQLVFSASLQYVLPG